VSSDRRRPISRRAFLGRAGAIAAGQLRVVAAVYEIASGIVKIV
jgi:hypothetical protein